MDYCDGGTVAQLLRSQRLEESHAAFIIRKVIRGIAYLHASRVLHRDIKSENILMNVDTRVFIGTAEARCVGCGMVLATVTDELAQLIWVSRSSLASARRSPARQERYVLVAPPLPLKQQQQQHR